MSGLFSHSHLYHSFSCFNFNYQIKSIEFFYPLCLWAKESHNDCQRAGNFYFIHFVCGRKNRIVTASKLVIVFYPLFLWAKESRGDCQQAGKFILSTLFVGERIAYAHYSIILLLLVYFLMILNKVIVIVIFK